MVNETLAEVLQSDQEVEAIRQETKETIQTLKQKNQAALTQAEQSAKEDFKAFEESLANQQAQAFEHYKKEAQLVHQAQLDELRQKFNQHKQTMIDQTVKELRKVYGNC